ncbi:hypothetical protein J7E93_22725 [Streptomyces sp. ISL-36]|uniref:hypothetical protein n=1 Tax=Streptomyces sp. ISL-36 TaxID=2819182 RepID=UPI001BE9353C|nr:hypothetical protein [Streptomyces sp. ISL-36]MBT2442868.1 hypothetical protein [Streptomyces sp. ISL-36]
MTIRDEVHEFMRLGPLPSEEDDSEEGDEAFEELTNALHAIEKPVTDEEAQLLLGAFGDDECFGLAWTLLHLVESAPTAPVTAEPPEGSNEWIERLWIRYRNTLSD